MRLKGSSPASVVRCKKLVFWRRRGGADSTRVHPHGASAKRRRSDACVAAPVNLIPEQRARAILDQVAFKSEGNLVVPMYLEPSSPLFGDERIPIMESMMRGRSVAHLLLALLINRFVVGHTIVSLWFLPN